MIAGLAANLPQALAGGLERHGVPAGIDTLVLAGISTSGVVPSRVRDAHDRDYRVLVLADASADPEPEVHDFLASRILSRQADVITVEGFARLLG